mgnify:CR=1 FL=1
MTDKRIQGFFEQRTSARLAGCISPPPAGAVKRKNAPGVSYDAGEARRNVLEQVTGTTGGQPAPARGEEVRIKQVR